jgi:hypothetical protein
MKSPPKSHGFQTTSYPRSSATSNDAASIALWSIETTASSTFDFALLAHRAWNPPPSSSLAEEERLRSLLLRATARDFRRSQCGDNLLFAYAGGHKRRFRDHERLLPASDVHRHNVIVLDACFQQREGDAGLEGG